MENEIFLVSNHEFLLLAASVGIESLYGFDLQPELLEKQEAIYSLQELTSKGWLCVEHGTFFPTGKIQEIFKRIKNAETIVEVHKKSGKRCILYISDCTIFVAESMRRNDMYEVSAYSTDDIWLNLQEEGWI